MRVGEVAAVTIWTLAVACSSPTEQGDTSDSTCELASTGTFVVPDAMRATCAATRCFAIDKAINVERTPYRAVAITSTGASPAVQLAPPDGTSGPVIEAGTTILADTLAIVTGAKEDSGKWRHAVDFVRSDADRSRIEVPGYEAPAPTSWVVPSADNTSVLVVPRWGTAPLGGLGYLVTPGDQQARALGKTPASSGIWLGFTSSDKGYVGARLELSTGNEGSKTGIRWFDTDGAAVDATADLDDDAADLGSLSGVDLLYLSDGRTVAARHHGDTSQVLLFEVYGADHKRTIRSRWCPSELSGTGKLLPRADGGWIFASPQIDSGFVSSHWTAGGELVVVREHPSLDLVDSVDGSLRALPATTSGGGRAVVTFDAWGNKPCKEGETCASCEDGDPCTVDDCAPSGTCRHAQTETCPSSSDGSTCQSPSFLD